MGREHRRLLAQQSAGHDEAAERHLEQALRLVKSARAEVFVGRLDGEPTGVLGLERGARESHHHGGPWLPRPHTHNSTRDECGSQWHRFEGWIFLCVVLSAMLFVVGCCSRCTREVFKCCCTVRHTESCISAIPDLHLGGRALGSTASPKQPVHVQLSVHANAKLLEVRQRRQQHPYLRRRRHQCSNRV